MPETKVDIKKVLTHAFILDDGKVISAEDIIRSPMIKTKAIEDGSTQEEIRSAPDPGSKNDKLELVDPPYEPSILAKFFDADEINFRCCSTKMTDAIGRGYEILSVDPKENMESPRVAEEVKVVRDFFRTCNRYDRFFGVWKQAALNYEAIGWGAVEVVRSFDMRVAKLVHLPADKVRVIKGWHGFAEIRNDGNLVYYQCFGDKVVSKNRKKMDGTAEPFDIELDGGWDQAEWSLKNRYDFTTQQFIQDSANEIIFVPKYHPKTIYYGIPDIVPAIGYSLANLNIRDFLLQFFDYNTIPQYAVIIEGADLSAEVKSLIASYFARDVKGQQHRTLIIPIPSAVGGEVKVHFEKLEQGTGEGHIKVREQNQTSIMVAHGMSPAIIGIADSANLGSGKGGAQMENYRERIVSPLQEMWAERINEFLKIGLGVQKVKVAFDPLSVEERSKVFSDYSMAVKMAAMTVNQFRALMKLGPPFPGGNRPFVMTPSGPFFLDQMETPDAAGAIDKLAAEVDKIRADTEVQTEERKVRRAKVQESKTKRRILRRDKGGQNAERSGADSA